MIPERARRILDFIGEKEAPRGYGDVYAPNRKMLGRDLETMTVDEVLHWQEWLRARGARSTAAGRYQIIYKTLRGLKPKLGLTGAETFDRAMQDRMGFSLMLGRGWDRFARGEMSVEGFAKALAQEWASMPVLTECRGASRTVLRGESYYADDGLNAALVDADRFEALLREPDRAWEGETVGRETESYRKLPATTEPAREGFIALLKRIFGGLWK